MHLVLPFASGVSEDASAALHSLSLPRLERLLPRLESGAAIGLDASSLNLPHEHVLARLRGWQGEDGCLPFAAAMARADGLANADESEGWGLLTPSHWQVGREQIVLHDPQALALDEAESRALLQAVLPLFEGEGWALHWGAPLRWYARHASLRDLATASLDRVVGRAIDGWLPDRLAARQVRRLQAEVQMLLHGHALNDAREAREVLPANSFWLSGTGRTQRPAVDAEEPLLDLCLRESFLAEDWSGWAEAWQALDAQRLAELEAVAARGEEVSLTLCGERCAQSYRLRPSGLWARLTRGLRRASAVDVLEAL